MNTATLRRLEKSKLPLLKRVVRRTRRRKKKPRLPPMLQLLKTPRVIKVAMLKHQILVTSVLLTTTLTTA